MRRVSVLLLAVIVMICIAGEKTGTGFDYQKEKRAGYYVKVGRINTEIRICEVAAVKDDYFSLVVEGKRTGRIMITVRDKERIKNKMNVYDLPGHRAVIDISTSLPESASNPGVFDYAEYLKTEGIYLCGECGKNGLSVGALDKNIFKGWLINRVSVCRADFYERLKTAAGETCAGFYCGMLFGEKEWMPEEIYENFRNNGTAHILSVSGLHVGIIYGAVRFFFRKRPGSPAALVASMGSICLMAVLASFSVSVMRAAVMIGLHILAERTYNRYDMISAACVTASFFLIFRPHMLYSSGFILSFAAVLSLAVIGKRIEDKIEIRNIITGTLNPIVSIQLGTAPINAYFFNLFSPAAFISNIPVIFLSSIMIPLGMFSFLISLITVRNNAVISLLFHICSLLSETTVFFNNICGIDGKLSYKAVSPSPMIMLLYYFVLFLIFSEFFYLHPPGRKTSVIIAVILILIPADFCYIEKQKPEIVFLDIGQGDCACIKTPEGKNYMFDGGGSLFSDYDVGEKVIEPYLLKNGIDEIDGVFISHMDADHYKGIASLNREFKTGRVYLYSGYSASENTIAGLLNKDKNEIRYLSRGDRVILGKDVYVDVLYPYAGRSIDIQEKNGDGDTEIINESSLILRLNYCGVRILFTGDIGKEEDRIKGNISCDIVKVPHHGSKYSSSEEFVKRLDCRVAVIQVGKNNFGHPAESVIERYRKNDIIVVRNDEDGAVTVDIDKGKFTVRGYKSEEEYEFCGV